MGTKENGIGNHVAWTQEAPRQRPGYVPIFRPAVGQEIELVLMQSVATGVWLHWLKGRSLPHLGGDGNCPYCLPDSPCRLYAYISAWSCTRHIVGVAEITQDALCDCPELLEPLAARPLLGRHVLVRREKGHRQSRCWVRMLQAVETRAMGPAPDVRAVLEHMWSKDPETAAILGLNGAPLAKVEKGGHHADPS